MSAHLPGVRAEARPPPRAAGHRDTKGRLFSAPSRAGAQPASLEPRGKRHRRPLNPAWLVRSSDREMKHPRRCIQGDAPYGRRCGSRRRACLRGAAPFWQQIQRERKCCSPSHIIHTEAMFDLFHLSLKMLCHIVDTGISSKTSTWSCNWDLDPTTCTISSCPASISCF